MAVEAFTLMRIAFIRSQNIYNEGFSWDGLVYLDEKLAQGLANVQVEDLDILLNITGDSVARTCQVLKDVLPARVNQHVAIIRPNPKILWPTYLRYYLVSYEMQAHMLALAAVGATRNALTKSMIESFSIKCPKSVNGQKSIADVLATLDDKIDLNRRINQTVPKTIDKYYTGKTHCGMSSSMTFPEQFWKRFAYRDSAGKVQIAPNGRVSAKGAGLAFA